MLYNRESRFCDYDGILHELDYLNLEGHRNIANDPEYIELQNKLMYEACVEMRERRYRHAIYSIQQQPFYM